MNKKLLLILLSLLTMLLVACGKDPVPEPTPQKEALTAPVITAGDDGIAWEAVPNADRYDVYLDGNLVCITSELSYTLLEQASGEYSLYVKASRADRSYLDSGASNKVSLIGTAEAERLVTPTVKLKDGKLVWMPIEGAEYYDITTPDGRTVAIVSAYAACEWDLSLPEDGEYTVRVQACVLGETFPRSEPSQEITFTVTNKYLAAPVVTCDGANLYWPAVENADDYAIYMNGQILSAPVIKEESGIYRYAFTHMNEGSYTYEIKALTNDLEYAPEGKASEALTCTIASMALWDGKTAHEEWQHTGSVALHSEGLCLEATDSTASISCEIEITAENAYLYLSLRKFTRTDVQDKNPAVEIKVNGTTVRALGAASDRVSVVGDAYELFCYDLSAYTGKTVTITISNYDSEHACFNAIGIADVLVEN